MPATNAALRKLVGVTTNEASDDDLDGYLAVATDIVDEHLDGDAFMDVPGAVLERAYLLVAAEMFGQDQAPNGVLNQQYDNIDGTVSTPVRISSDPMRPAYVLLAPWRLVTIA